MGSRLVLVLALLAALAGLIWFVRSTADERASSAAGAPQIRLERDPGDGSALVGAKASEFVDLPTTAGVSMEESWMDPPVDDPHVRAMDQEIEPRVHCIVVDAISTLPVTSAAVSLLRFPDASAAEREVTRQPLQTKSHHVWTADGKFSLAVFATTDLVLMISAPGYATAFFDAPTEPTPPEAPRALPLEREARIEAIVVGVDDRPLSGVRVRCVPIELAERAHGFLLPPSALDGALEHLEYAHPQLSDVNGSVHFRSLPPGKPLYAELWRDDDKARRRTEIFTLSPGEQRAFSWSFSATARVRGVLIDQGGFPIGSRAVSLAPVLIGGSTRYLLDEDRVISTDCTVTDPAGRFDFEGVGSGTWMIAPVLSVPGHFVTEDEVKTFVADLQGAGIGSRAQGEIAAVAVPFEILDFDLDVEIDLRICEGLYVTGRVIDITGAPIERVLVTATTAKLGGHVETMSGRDGWFKLGPVVDEVHRIVARKSLLALQSNRIPFEIDPEASEVAVREIQSAPIESGPGSLGSIVLTLPPAATIRGRVSDDESDSHGEALIVLIPADARPGRWIIASTIATPRFLLTDLAAGIYSLLATCPDGWTALTRDVLVQSIDDVDVGEMLLAPPVELRVRHEPSFPRDVNLEIDCDGVLVYAERAPLGAEAVVQLPAGTYSLRLTLADGTVLARTGARGMSGATVATEFITDAAAASDVK